VAHDPELADRLRELLATEPGVREQRAFGGLAFLVDGHMAISASSRGGLLVRVDPERSAELCGQEHVRPFQMRGRPIAGWLDVDPAAAATEADLQRWVDVGVGFARTLPAK
jgi:hypothetical protein